MRGILALLSVAALFAFTGCGSGTTGGPGADKAKKDEESSKIKKALDKVRQPEDTFSLSVPTLSTKIKQGESKAAVIGISRGKDFGEDVSLKFEGVPKGVTLEPAETVIKAGDKEAKLTIKATDDAALGDFTIKVMGHPKKGEDATNDLKITIQKK